MLASLRANRGTPNEEICAAAAGDLEAAQRRYDRIYWDYDRGG